METLRMEQNTEFLGDSNPDYFESHLDQMPRGHAFCLRDLYEGDWQHFSKSERASLRRQFDDVLEVRYFPNVISLGINEQGHEVFTKTFYELRST